MDETVQTEPGPEPVELPVSEPAAELEARSQPASGAEPAPAATAAAAPAATAAVDQFELRLLRGRGGHGGLVLTLRTVPAAGLLAAVQLLITASPLSRSWWWQDDLNLLATGARRPLTPGLLLSDYISLEAPDSGASICGGGATLGFPVARD